MLSSPWVSQQHEKAYEILHNKQRFVRSCHLPERLDDTDVKNLLNEQL